MVVTRVQDDKRRLQLDDWLQEIFQHKRYQCEPASSDASFRRYFRVTEGGKSFIVMDAPPEKEDCEPFVQIAAILRKHDVQAPVVFQRSVKEGFLLLSDFGSINYLDQLTPQTANTFYLDAIRSLHKMQDIRLIESNLPLYSEGLFNQEMTLFRTWFLQDLLGLMLSNEDIDTLDTVQQTLLESALEQPQVFVHRDYHSRNLMLTAHNNPGVIDFQDAVHGPLCYDLVSLLRDCYISWPDEKVYVWLDAFMAERLERGLQDDFDASQFYTWFDLMGVQRHMKAVGIFSRLLIRDGKPNYIHDIPRTLCYIEQVAARYEALLPLSNLLKKHDINIRLELILQKNNNA